MISCLALVLSSLVPAHPSPHGPGQAAGPLAQATPVQEAAGDDLARIGPRATQEQLEAWTASILEDIEEMRGEKFKRPVSVAVADAAGFREYVNARMEKHTTPEVIEAEVSLAKLLGLVPASMDYMATLQEMLDDQVGGFYDPEIEGFFLMDRFGGDLARTILAHELTHALDDQLYDIDGTLEGLKGNGDAEFAYQAVVEGSGTTLMNAWTMQHMAELDFGQLADMDALGTESLSEVPAYLWKPLLGAYLRGAAFLNRTDNAMMGSVGMPANDDVRAAFRSPPRSSEQILHPNKYWRADRRDEPIEVDIEVGQLTEGWRVLDEDTLGELGWAMVLAPESDRGGLDNPLAVLGLRYTYPAAEGWGGDRFVLLGKGDARVLLAHTVWDSPADAREFGNALEAQRQRLEGAAAACAELLGSAPAAASASGLVLRDVALEGEREVALRLWHGASASVVERLAASVKVTVGVAATR